MNFYVILGVQQGATESEIKRAYRRLARRFHPDINPGDHTAEVRFRQIVQAYETLVDPERRSRYDTGSGGESADERRSGGFEGFDFSVRGVDHSATFGDLFSEVLAERGAARDERHRGADLHHALEVTFEEAFAGTRRSIALTRRETCRTCAGSGLARPTASACSTCHGTGTVRSVRGHMVFSRRCSACGGTGHQRPRPCDPCGGTGQDTRVETVQVQVPPGAAHGDRLRVPAKGNAGLRGGTPGDLYVMLHVTPHPVFRREGDDLHVVVPVAIHEAALGARVDVPALDGAARLRIPPGTQSGQRFRLRERGAVAGRQGQRGDLIVEVRLMLPRMLDERSKELLREFGRLNGESVREG